MSNWREVHVGTEGDELKLAGLEVWRQTWRRTNEDALQLPHPNYPHQLDRFDIYEIGRADQPVRFAASELSNGVWGFYVPTRPQG